MVALIKNMDNDKNKYSVELFLIIFFLGLITYNLFALNKTLSNIYSDTQWITGFLETNLTK